MRHILILGLVFFLSTAAHANVRQTAQEFYAAEINTDEALFWGEILTLKQWESKARSQWLRLDQHPQYTALSTGMAERSYPLLSQEEMTQVLGDLLGQEFYFSYSNKDEEYRLLQESKAFKPQTALMFEVKVGRTVQVPWTRVVDTFGNSVELLTKMDQPHRHIEVSADFAHRLIEPLHSGHEIIDSMGAQDRLVFSVIRMEDYECSVMSQLLDLATEIHGESVAELNGKPVVNIYSLSRISRVPDADLARYAEIVGTNPKAVFVQDMIFSSRFVKDVKNLWAIVPVGDNQTHVVSYTVMATTDKLKSALSLALSGPTPTVLGELVSNKTENAADKVIEAANGILDSLLGSEVPVAGTREKYAPTSRFPMTMTTDVVDLNSSPLLSACQVGLTKGIPKYVHGMFENLVSTF
jgi:hypothetical protein